MNKIVSEDILSILNQKNIKWKNFKNKNILISGANSFLANYIINIFIYLNIKKKYKIKLFLLSRKNKLIYQKFINLKTKTFIKVLNNDLKNKIKLNVKIHHILHLASIASPKLYKKFPVETMIPNIIGTYNLLMMCNKNFIKSFIYMSSGEIYGSSKRNLTEKNIGSFDTLNLRASYIESKKAGETLCYSFFKQKKIPIKIIRLFHTYGPYMNLSDGRVMMDFVKNILNKKNIIIKSNGKQIRSFCYIKDTIIGLFVIWTKGLAGQAYNLGNSKETYSINSLAKLLSKKFSIKILKKIRNKTDSYMASPFNIMKPCIKKINKLGFKPTVNAKNGFERTIKFYENNQSN